MTKMFFKSQSLDLFPFENVWQDPNVFVYWRSLTDLTQPKQFCEEEWANIAPSQCAHCLENDAKRLQVIAAVSRWFNHVVTNMNEYFKVMIFQFAVIVSWLIV